MVGVLMIVAGFALGAWAYPQHKLIESQRAVIFQGPIGNLIHLIATVDALVLKIWGLVVFRPIGFLIGGFVGWQIKQGKAAGPASPQAASAQAGLTTRM